MKIFINLFRSSGILSNQLKTYNKIHHRAAICRDILFNIIGAQQAEESFK